MTERDWEALTAAVLIVVLSVIAWLATDVYRESAPSVEYVRPVPWYEIKGLQRICVTFEDGGRLCGWTDLGRP